MMETSHLDTDVRRCPVCREVVPPNLRCLCEMVQDQRADSEPQAVAGHIERFDNILRRDWKALVTITCIMVSLIFGVMLARLSDDGQRMVEEFAGTNDRMEVVR
jgi:hypothetical protein